MSPGGMNDSTFAENVAFYLGLWSREIKLGRVWINEAGIVVESDPDTVRGADVAYISYKRLPKGTSSTSFSRVAPELVVEVLGKGQGWTEILEKAAEYLKMGVDRVWILDPSSKCVHVYRQNSGPVVLTSDDTIEAPEILPGFSCRVASFFEI